MHMSYRQVLTISQEVVERTFHTDLGLTLREASQYFLDGNRLLGLVGIAEDGEPKFSRGHHFFLLFAANCQLFTIFASLIWCKDTNN